MTRKLIHAVYVAILLGVASSTTFRTSATQTQDVLSTDLPAPEAYQPYICPDTGDALIGCLEYIADACVCYNNGTCANTQANKCSTCQQEDVISVTEGVTCAQEQIEGTPYRCRPSQIDEPPICPLVLIPACVCYTNGTCIQGSGSNCTECWQDDVAYVIERGTCPPNGIQPITHVGFKASEENQEGYFGDRFDEAVEEEQTEGLNRFQYFVCPDRNPAAISCSTQIWDACVCYSNGTCANTQASPCNTCFDTAVISVNIDTTCPTPALDGHWTRCIRSFGDANNEREEGEGVFCTRELREGCTCYNSGECEEGMVNACFDCQKEGVALVIEGPKCPENGIHNISRLILP